MCFELDSVPPIPVLAGAALAHEELVLESADGNRFAAFAAMPEQPEGAAVAILPDVRGLYRFYEELALRFAERGHPAVAFDYFGRSAGVSRRDEQFDFAEHVAQTTPEGVQQDLAAVLAYLRGPAGGAARDVFTVGFCFGGRHSWLAAAASQGIAGAIGFYGMPGERNGAPGPTQLAASMTAPILALQAGDDDHIPAEANAAFEHALSAAGVEHELIVFEGAPHSFFDRRHEEFAAQSDRAWRRTLAFIAAHSS